MILEKIHTPHDLKNLNFDELRQLCEELRVFVNNSEAGKTGHKNASIAVTELSVALHFVLDTPHDILIWDVGHQAYIHKILTGRKDVFHTNRKKGGLAGFTNARESSYDPFGAGHSSTSISAATGFALANKLKQGSRKQVAVIGDGAITGGMGFEAINFLGGESGLDVLVILNDNQSSIDQNVGGLSISGDYKNYCRSMGLDYIGEIDGHNVEELIKMLEKALELTHPRMLRVKTKKPASKSALTAQASPLKFQEIFADTLIGMAENNDRIVAITPAMLSGSGLTKFQQRFPNRTFDVGIAEQHAVTMAAGLAADGFLPVVHLYSTFSQRAYDQIIHDVALQNLHVIFCLDRAGLVGEDGATHHGNFDPGFLNTIPGLTVAAPIDGNALESIMQQSVAGTGPWFIRYPKGDCEFREGTIMLDSTKATKLKDGVEKAVLSFGAIGTEVKKALEDFRFAHYDFGFLKPLDLEKLDELALVFSELITVEENSPRGGLGDSVRAYYAANGVSMPVKSLALPDVFVEHASREQLLGLCGLDANSIRQFIEGS